MTQHTRRTSLAETRNIWQLRREDALKLRLRNAPPDLWYEIARRADPDLHADLLFWMISQKQCDFSVALHILLTGPIRYHVLADTPLPATPDETSLWAAILMNWHRGHYRTHEIACDRSLLDDKMRDLRTALDSKRAQGLSFPMPEAMLDLTGGRPIALLPADNPDQALDLWKMCRDLDIAVDPSPPGVERLATRLLQTAAQSLGRLRDAALSVRFNRHRHLFHNETAYLDWVSDYYVNRVRHREVLQRLQTVADPNPAMRFGTAAALSAAMGFMVLGGAALGIMDLLKGG